MSAAPRVPPQWAEDFVEAVPWRNAASNAAYVLVAGWAATRGPTGMALALALGMLAAGSGWYHATKQAGALAWDRGGMHAVFAALAVHGMAPRGGWLVAACMLALGAGAAWAFVWRRYRDLTWAMGCYLVLALLEAVLLGALGWALASVGLFALSYGLWVLDRRRVAWLAPWGHACWHVGTAAAIGVLYRAQGG